MDLPGDTPSLWWNRTTKNQKGYFSTVVYNEANRLERARYTAEKETQQAEPLPDPEDRYKDDPQERFLEKFKRAERSSALVQRVLRTLPARQAQAFELWLENASAEESAEYMGLDPKTYRRYLKRAQEHPALLSAYSEHLYQRLQNKPPR